MNEIDLLVNVTCQCVNNDKKQTYLLIIFFVIVLLRKHIIKTLKHVDTTPNTNTE